MASKTKQTTVAHRYLSACPSIPLRILAYLLSRSAYAREVAVEVSEIARELGIETDEVRFDCLSLCAPGFAILETSELGTDQQTTAVYIETDYDVIRCHALLLEGHAARIRGRGVYLKRCAMAMVGACHPWNTSVRPALGESVA